MGGLYRCALGIDVGLTGVRAAVATADGRLLGRARVAVSPRFPAPGRAEADARDWAAGALAAGVAAVAEAGVSAVDAVGLGALGPAPVLVDERLEPLAPALLFSLDTRAEAERERLGVTHDHALPKLLWWAEHEPAFAGAAWALDATGYVVSSLTGRPVMDAITRLDYGEPPLPVPEPVEPLAVAGGLTRDAARALGVAAGTPVAAGTYDTYVDVAGVGVRRPGDACVLLGSTLVLCRAVAEPVECPGLELAPYPGEGFLLGGWTTAGGATIDWFARTLGAAGDARGLEPGAGGLLALPYLAGERTPVRDPDARGVVLGLTLATTAVELRRAAVDAVALSARDHDERLAAAGLSPEWWIAGGGGTRDEAWLHATADALGAPLAVAAHAGEAVGPARLALRAVGVEPETPTAFTVEPDAARHERYGELYELYRGLHPALADLMHALT